MIWLTIVLMALVVFASRYLFLEPRLPLRLGKTASQLLEYAAPAILTAITTPIVFLPHGQLWLGFDSPYLVSALVAVLIALVSGRVLLTTLLSLGLFLLLKL